MENTGTMELLMLTVNNLSKRVEKIENLLNSNEGKLDDMAKINSEINVIAKHIAVLERKNRSFFDRFKFGRFKPIGIEAALKIEKPIKKVNFSFNDD